MSFKALPVLALAALTAGCRLDNAFRGTHEDPDVKNSDALSYDLPDDFELKFGDVLKECHETTITPHGDGILRLVLPRLCSYRVPDPDPRLRALDLVFVLDVTGSMRSELDSVRQGMQELISIAQTTGWDLQVGAVAFADAILARYPLTPDLADLSAKMAPENPIWAAPDGFGGDEPEVGLAAIESGLNMLREGQGYERLLVYVSDAPARRVDKGGYSVDATGGTLQKFLRSMSDADAAFHLFFSSTDSRERLFSDMPTPVEQIEELVARSGVESTKLPFPLHTRQMRDNFLQPLQNVRFTSDLCEFTRAELVDPVGQVVPAPLGVSETLLALDLTKVKLTEGMKVKVYGTCKVEGEKVVSLTFDL